jgi:hypothetical protein
MAVESLDMFLIKKDLQLFARSRTSFPKGICSAKFTKKVTFIRKACIRALFLLLQKGIRFDNWFVIYFFTTLTRRVEKWNLSSPNIPHHSLISQRFHS